jgi:hypothetical protein
MGWGAQPGPSDIHRCRRRQVFDATTRLFYKLITRNLVFTLINKSDEEGKIRNLL